MMIRHFFFTGTPSVGKTTALLRIVQTLPSQCKGFYTESVYSDSQKTGLVLRSMNGYSLKINKAKDSKNSFSGYDFDCTAFEEFCVKAFRPLYSGDYVVIDELGPLFCRSEQFVKSVEGWFDGYSVLGVIAKKGHRLIESIHRRTDTKIIELTAENRDETVSAVSGQLFKQTEK